MPNKGSAPQADQGKSARRRGPVADNAPVANAPAPFRFLHWPTDDFRIAQPFGVNPEVYQPFGLPGHEGVDIAASDASPVFCVAPGQVKMVNTPTDYAGNNHPYGVHVRVLHASDYETIYAHMKELHVHVGQPVEAGQVLGLADHTGNVFGDPPDHLHLTLKHAGESAPGYPNNIIDPMPFLRLLLAPTTAVVLAQLDTSQHRVAEKLGLNCNAPIGPDGAITPRLANPQLIRDTGVEWVRLNFIVRPFAGPDDPQWIATYRQIIAGLRAQGLRIYGLIGAEAVGEDPGNQFRHEPPAGPVDNAWIRTYAQNFRKIVDLFGKDVPLVESFNEPNDWHRTPGDATKWEQAWIHPGWFAIMLQRVYEAVRDLDMTLVSGPLLSTEDGNDAAHYLPNVYAAGAARFGWGQPATPAPFDGVGYHPYVLRDPPNPHADIPARYQQYMSEVREVIRRFEGADKPLFLSEIGWQTPHERQVACMEAGLGCALDDPSVALCIWYGMQDDAGESYGLYRKEGLSVDQRKPVYNRFVLLANDPRTVPVAQVRSKQPSARFVGEFDNVPDGSVLEPGHSFTKTWRMQNTGAATWDEGCHLVAVGGPTLGAPHMVPIASCRPGETIDITVSFIAPLEAGDYTSTWSLADPRQSLFGDQVWTTFRVAAAPPAAAPVAPALAAALPSVPAGAVSSVEAPLLATALAIINQTYWMRVLAAAAEPNPQQAIQAAADDALARIEAFLGRGKA